MDREAISKQDLEWGRFLSDCAELEYLDVLFSSRECYLQVGLPLQWFSWGFPLHLRRKRLESFSAGALADSVKSISVLMEWCPCQI